MIKSTRNGYCDHVRIFSARVENSGELGWVWLQFGRGAAVWEGRGGMGKKKKEKQRKRVSADWWVYNGFFDGITDGLLPSVIPSAIPSVKVSRHCTAISV
jgi:hypothetical protein